jgi:hypothetical protein
MSDQRSPWLIVRPAKAPTKKELKKSLPASEVLVCLKDWAGRAHWFHLEYASVWPLELDGYDGPE